MSLANAIRAAIHNGNVLADIKVQYWAETYGVTTEEIKATWEQIAGESVA